MRCLKSSISLKWFSYEQRFHRAELFRQEQHVHRWNLLKILSKRGQIDEWAWACFWVKRRKVLRPNAFVLAVFKQLDALNTEFESRLRLNDVIKRKFVPFYSWCCDDDWCSFLYFSFWFIQTRLHRTSTLYAHTKSELMNWLRSVYCLQAEQFQVFSVEFLAPKHDQMVQYKNFNNSLCL